MNSRRPRTLTGTLARNAFQRPHHPALVCGSTRITYRELERRTDRTAAALADAGVGVGARVAHVAQDSELYHELLFACARIGAVLVPVDWRLTATELEHVLRDCGAAAVFHGSAQTAAVRRAAPTTRVVVDLADFARWRDTAPNGSVPCGREDPNAPVAQLYTSGTTGRPKGVVLAQRTFFAVADLLDEHGLTWIDWQRGDRSLVCVPGFHVGGLWWATQGLNAGVTNVLLPVFDSLRVLEVVRDQRITTTCMVPAMMRTVLDEPDATAGDFASLRKLVYGGSPISTTLLHRAMAVFGCDLAQIYGLTETGNTAVCLPPADHRAGGRRLAAAGLPYPGVRLRIVATDGTDAPTGSVGQIAIATPAHMIGYWRQPDRTAATLVDGWVLTGDAGYLDDAGYLHIRDRISDMIIVGGENVYPAEVENALCRHPAVVEAAVVGAPDTSWGERVCAYVVLRDGHDVGTRQLTSFLRAELAGFKVPTRYDFVGAVPRNPSGKILRGTLRNQLWAGMERKVN
jgi:long-chain acyl-CoA synthetase